VATTAVRRAVESLRRPKAATMRVPVIFDAMWLPPFLDDIFRRLPPAMWRLITLADRADGKPAFGSDLVTIVDDGRLVGKLGAHLSTGRVPTQRTPVFERGTLRTFLYDTYYGRKLGAATPATRPVAASGRTNFT